MEIPRPHVFVDASGRVFSSPTSDFRRPVPLPDCDIDNPEDTLIAHWGTVVRPELPGGVYIMISRTAGKCALHRATTGG